MYSEKTAKEMIKIQATNIINDMRELVESVKNDEDLFGISLLIDKAERDFHFHDILKNCEDW